MACIHSYHSYISDPPPQELLRESHWPHVNQSQSEQGSVRFKHHWMFQIYKYVIIGHEELTSCSSVKHSYLLPLLDVVYRQVGNLPFWSVSCTEFRHGGQSSYSGRHSGSWEHNDISCQTLSDWPVLGRVTFKVSRFKIVGRHAR